MKILDNVLLFWAILYVLLQDLHCRRSFPLKQNEKKNLFSCWSTPQTGNDSYSRS